MEINELVAYVLDLEWEMFSAVNAGSQPASCQTSPEKFRAIRSSVFQMWSKEMLACYLIQLSAAQAEGRNLLAEKYARMDNLIPPLTDSPYLDGIVEISEIWQRELEAKFPALYGRCCRTMEPTGDGKNFSVYLRCELETYGDNTLVLYYENVKHAYEQNRNLSIEALKHLIEKSGYMSLEQAEGCIRQEETSMP